eukprot:gnl/MRDRNA2_/MRDRNA2_188573_c0_seq1.p1 gnl/MRDRNA2_/MRDRNA2_188573_c0~~gnl/MRDRNA2_/MRDRNA2_188573_c0_seq1.p1  ORF type:complete len:174 (+),score=12.51 gnl/MRDRNA2_/MRDRNA2_188573_c0_seq1:76-597(+)
MGIWTRASAAGLACALVIVAFSLHGCGSSGGAPPGPPGPPGCDHKNITCQIKKACSVNCDNFNITTKAVAEECIGCVANKSQGIAEHLCTESKADTEHCVECILYDSVYCWNDPASIGNCLVGPCTQGAVIADPLKCPECWLNYVSGCFQKYETCFINDTMVSSKMGRSSIVI